MKIKFLAEKSEHSLYLDYDDSRISIEALPESKKYNSTLFLKYDAYCRVMKHEYQIITNPLKVEVRLIERIDMQPHEKYLVRDGVVLQTEIIKESNGPLDGLTRDLIGRLEEEVVWHTLEDSDVVSMYLLSLHPEIVSTQDFRRHLRLLSEKIKISTKRVQDAIKSDTSGIQVLESQEELKRSVWYPKSRLDKMSEKEIKIATEHHQMLLKRLFSKESREYVGFSQGEFRVSLQTLKAIDIFLDEKGLPQEELNKKTSFVTKIRKFIF